MAIFCPNCGKEAVEGARFCEDCGQSLQPVQQAVFEQPVYEQPVQQQVFEQPAQQQVFEQQGQPVYEQPAQQAYAQQGQQAYGQQGQQQYYTPQMQQPKKKSKLPVIIGVIVGVVLLIGAGTVGAAAYLTHKAASTIQENPDILDNIVKGEDPETPGGVTDPDIASNTTVIENPSRWVGTFEISGASGEDIENETLSVYGVVGTTSEGKSFLEIYDYLAEDPTTDALLSFYCDVEDERIVPVIDDPNDAWIMDTLISAEESDNFIIELKYDMLHLNCDYVRYDNSANATIDAWLLPEEAAGTETEPADGE